MKITIYGWSTRMRLRRHFLHFQRKGLAYCKGPSCGGLVFCWAFSAAVGLAAASTVASRTMAVAGLTTAWPRSKGAAVGWWPSAGVYPIPCPRPLATVASSLAYWIPIGQATASIRVIHPLRVMLLHPGLAIT